MKTAVQSELSLRQKVLSGLRWSAGLRFLGQLLTWLITIVVMRKLSPQDYGLMGMAGIAISYLTSINEIGLGASIIQRKSLDDTMIRQIFGLLILVNLGFFLSSFLLAPLISSFFSEQRLVPLIRVLSIQFLLSSFVIIPESLIDRDMLFRQKSVVDLASAIAGSLTTLALAWKGWGVWALVWGTVTLMLLRTLGFVLIRPCMRLPEFSFNKIRESISFGGYVTMTRILWSFYSQFDILIVGKFLGKQLLGYYSVALTLASLPMEKVSGLINQVAFPAFARIQGDTQQAAKHFLKSVKIMSLIAFPALWGISSIAPDVVYILLTDRWEAAIMPLRLLSLIIPFRMISSLVGPMLLGLGRSDLLFFYVLATSITIPFGVAIGSFWGLFGVSIAWVAVFPPVFLWNMSRVVHVLEITVTDIFSVMAKPILAAIAMYLSLMLIRTICPFDVYSIPCLGFLIISGIVVYGVIILILDRETCMDIYNLARL